MATPVREALARAQRSAVHLEMRDSYMLDDPEFIAWQHGKRLDPEDRDLWWHGWHDAVAEATARGVVVRRARIVSEPLHDYVWYEHDLTYGNLATGEQVRWLPRRDTKDLPCRGWTSGSSTTRSCTSITSPVTVNWLSTVRRSCGIRLS